MSATASVCEIFRELSPQVSPLDTPHHQLNCSPELLTQRLSQLVPLFDFVGARVDSVSDRETRLVAPFRTNALNQNGTHQASVFYILADYASGIAAMSVLPGVYVIGVHDPCPGFPVQMWLKSGSVNHLAMGTGELEAVVRIRRLKAAGLLIGAEEVSHESQRIGCVDAAIRSDIAPLERLVLHLLPRTRTRPVAVWETEPPRPLA